MSIVGFGRAGNIQINGLNCRGRQILTADCGLTVSNITSNSLVLSGIAETMGPSLQVQGGFVEFKGDLVVEGELDVAQDSLLQGNVEISGDLDLTGDFNYRGDSANVGDVLTWDGTSWTPEQPASGGNGDDTIGFELVENDGASLSPTISSSYIRPASGEGASVIDTIETIGIGTLCSARDSLGNIYVGGVVANDSRELYNADGRYSGIRVMTNWVEPSGPAVIVKYNSIGEVQSYTSIPYNPLQMKVDSSDNLVVLFSVSVQMDASLTNFTTVSAQPAPVVSLPDNTIRCPFIARWSSAGNYLDSAYAEMFDNSQYFNLTDIEIDSNDNLYVAFNLFRFIGSQRTFRVTDFSFDPFSTPVFGSVTVDLLAAMDDVDRIPGVLKWNSSLQVSEYGLVSSEVGGLSPTNNATAFLGIDSADSVYLGFRFGIPGGTPTISFYDMATTTSSAVDTFSPTGQLSLLVVKWNSSGTLVWWQILQGTPASANEFYLNVAIDSSDNLYCSGLMEEINQWYDAVTVGGSLGAVKFTPPIPSSGRVPFILKMNSSGVLQSWWQDDNSDINSVHVHIDSNDDLVTFQYLSSGYDAGTKDLRNFTTSMSTPGTVAITTPELFAETGLIIKFDGSDNVNRWTTIDFFIPSPEGFLAGSGSIYILGRCEEGPLGQEARVIRDFSTTSSFGSSIYQVSGAGANGAFLVFDATTYEVSSNPNVDSRDLSFTLPARTTTDPFEKTVYFSSPNNRYALTITNAAGTCVVEAYNLQETRVDFISLFWTGATWATITSDIKGVEAVTPR